MGIEAGNTDDYRYPGTKFFEAGQQNIFFGREQETRDLVYSIKAFDVFVIFADSGIGKTSMLNAGLIPELEKENYEPIKFRFQDVSEPPLQVFNEKLSYYIDQTTGFPGDTNLWHMFKSCSFNNKLPLFIFDQFEEFFNHTKQNRQNFIDELAGLINEYLPDSIREEMRLKFRENDPTPEQVKYYTPVRVKLLFLIRADKLKLLDDLSKKIPFILKNRFYLRPLTCKQAEQAILLPALLPKNGFASPPFNFEDEAVDEICNYLKNGEGEVESFQLQILCRELEKRIISRSEKKEKGLWITKKELGGEAGMDGITKNYYTNQIAAISDDEMRNRAITLIEDKLIVDNRRISLPEILLINEGYSRTLLDYLLNTTRIIRAYNDRNSRYYEISHDRLLPSILKLKEKREEEESQLKAQRELEELKKIDEEKNTELKKEKNIKRRFRVLSIVMGVLFIALLFAFNQMIRMDTYEKMADVRYHNSIQDYNSSIQILNEKNMFSIFNFAFADSLNKLRDATLRYINNKRNYFDNVDKGDSLMFIADSSSAISELLINDALSRDRGWLQFTMGKDSAVSLLQTLKGDYLMKVRELYQIAQQIDFRPKDDDSSKVEYKLPIVDDKIKHSFGQNVYAVIFFVEAKNDQYAIDALRKAKFIDSMAYKKGISLDTQAKCVLDSLQNVLKL